MHWIVPILFVLFFFISVHGQNQCTCRCCLGQACPAVNQGVVSVNNCSAEACLSQCRCTYPQCAANYPYGVVMSECVRPSYACECRCCNSFTSACMPLLVGYANSFACDISSCSINCYQQYPTQCTTAQFSIASGTCVGPVTTTTTATTIASWFGYACSCYYCTTGYNCGLGAFIGMASATGCSSNECTLACQSRFPTSFCTTNYLKSIYGFCLSEMTGRTQCKCNCCGANTCIDYEISTNTSCSTCSAKCSQFSPCIDARPPTYTCTTSNTIRTVDFSFFNFFVIYLLTK